MKKTLATFLALLFLPVLAQAHSGGVHLSGFAEGFSHPFSGIDHIIAMLAVGIWAKQRGGHNLYLLPLTFVLVMVLSALLGMAGLSFAYTETGIMASNAVLIALVLISSRFSTAVSMAIVGFFAIFHGISHGAEMPLATESLSYMSGFITATSLLHGAGLCLAWLLFNRFSCSAIVTDAL
jgi:urease accessory protein